jgi:hypothetical protein
MTNTESADVETSEQAKWLANISTLISGYLMHETDCTQPSFHATVIVSKFVGPEFAGRTQPTEDREARRVVERLRALADVLRTKRLELNPDGWAYVGASSGSDYAACGYADALAAVEGALRKILAGEDPLSLPMSRVVSSPASVEVGEDLSDV